MDGKSQPESSGDRRGSDRRVEQQPFDGADKRIAQRRTLADRRSAPRRTLPT